MLSFWHASAEIIAQQAKLFDVVCSIEVVGQSAFLQYHALDERRRVSPYPDRGVLPRQASFEPGHTRLGIPQPEELVCFFTQRLTEASQP
jgi:hypothetical protein